MTAKISLRNWLHSGEMVNRNAAANALLDSDPNNRYTPASSAEVITVNMSARKPVDVVAIMRWDLSQSFNVTVHFRSGGVPVGSDILVNGATAALVYIPVSPARTVDRISFYRMTGELCAVFAGQWEDISIPPDVGGGGGILLNTESTVPVSGNAYLSYLPPLRRADLNWSNLDESEAAQIYAGVDYAYRNQSAVFILPDSGNIRESQTAVFGMIDSFAAPARTEEGVSGTSVGALSIRAEPATEPVIPTEVSAYPVPIFSVSAIFMDEGATRTGLELSLSRTPESAVTVALSAAPAAGLTITPASFNFTTSNYNNPQSFQIRAAHDGNNRHIQHTLTAAGVGLAGPGSININVFDDDAGAIDVQVSLRASTNGGLSYHGPGVLFERQPDQALPDFMLRAVLAAAVPVDVRVNLQFSGAAAASVRESDVSYIDISAGQLSADIEFPLGAPGSAAPLRIRVAANSYYTHNTQTIWIDWAS